MDVFRRGSWNSSAPAGHGSLPSSLSLLDSTGEVALLDDLGVPRRRKPVALGSEPNVDALPSWSQVSCWLQESHGRLCPTHLALLEDALESFLAPPAIVQCCWTASDDSELGGKLERAGLRAAEALCW